MDKGPDFSHPPVEEVILSVQFAPVRGLSTSALARYWQAIQDRFPTWRDAPTLDPVVERFGGPIGDLPRFDLMIRGGSAPLRALFGNASGTELVQVQGDRFVRNWRRQGHDEVYPRYRALRERFAADLGEFLAFLADGALGVPAINQCEVTYVNHIEGEGFDPHHEVGRVIATLSGAPSDDFLPAPEGVEATFRYVFPWPDRGGPAGRLHVAVRPVHRRPDGRPLIAATLTARGRPRGTDAKGALDWLDVGHDFLVRAFTSLTTPEMHDRWGRRHGR